MGMNAAFGLLADAISGIQKFVWVFVLVYGFFVWLSQYLSWYGVASLYEQHAFLLPVPFMGW